MNNRRTLVLVSLVLAGSVLMAVAHADDSFSLPVEAAAVSRTALIERIETVGTLRASEKVTLRPELGGRVERILFEDGQQVAAGRELLILDTAIREAELADAKARSLLAASEFKRNKDVTEKGLGSTQDLDRARAELLRAEAGETLARVRLGKMTLRAPFGGRLGLRQVSPGDFLQPGDAVVELVASDPIKLDFQIPESQAARVVIGQQVSIRVDAWPRRTFSGELTAIAPRVNEGGRSLMLRARLDNRDQALRPGMFARVTLSLGGDAQALTIPEQAIMPEGEQRFVYRIVDGKAVKTEVVTGRREAARVEVIDGLAEGEQVVVSGQIKLQDGSAVQAVPAAEG